MAAFCHGFLDDMDDKSLRADQGGLRADEQCEVRTPEPSLKKLRTLPTDDSLSSEPKHVNTSKAAIKPVSHGSLFKKAKPSNAAVAKSCAVALFQGAHTAPDKKRGKDTCPRADYGTQNTFAGRRPPKDPERRKAFDLMREDYAKLKVDAAKSSKKTPISQSHYWDYMSAALGKAGPGSQQEKFKAAAQGYRASLELQN